MSAIPLTKSMAHRAATAYTGWGLSVIPIADLRTKAPGLDVWKPYQERLPTAAEIDAWFGQFPGIGVVCGKVSGNLTVIDFDVLPDTTCQFDEWAELVADALPDLAPNLVVMASQSGGRHVYVRCAGQCDGSAKLAMSLPITAPSKKTGQVETRARTIIETKADGGQVVAPPTPGYKRLKGSLDAIPELSIFEYQTLIDLARTFDRELPTAAPAPRASAGDAGNRPGDRYNEAASGHDVETILLGAGWSRKCVRRDGTICLTRPGKSTRLGISATIRVDRDVPIFYCFSSNAAPFAENKGYAPFQVYALVEHAGDWKAAAVALAEQGYGDSSRALQIVRTQDTGPGDVAVVVEEGTTNDGLPVINVTDKRLRDVVAESLGALAAVESLYQRGGILLRLRCDDTCRLVSDPLDNDALRGMLERSADYVRYEPRRKRNLPIAPPLDLVRDLQALPDYSFRILAGIIETPVTRSDGTIVSSPGYDSQSRLFYEPPPGLCIPAIPEDPDDGDVRAAVAIYDEMLRDFPFADAAGKAHAMAMALTPFVRDMINGPTPMGMIDAPGPAAGKGLLADVICMPAFGAMLGNLGECGDDAEWRKQITSVLMESTRIVRIDNIANILDSASLARALTTTVWEDRVLGGNKIARIPVRCTWLGTGNNVISSTEIARRTLPIRLDPNEEQPQFRTGFTHINLRAWARSKRGELIAAALTLIRAWHNWGQPPGKVTIGSYEEWSTVLGGILDTAGIDGFLANTAEQHDPADTEMAMWGDFVQAWWATHKQRTVLAKDLIELAWDSNIPLRGTSPHAQKVELGMAIRHQRGRVIAGKKIAFTYNSDTKVTHWWLNPNPRDKSAQPSGAEEL